jgi:hypothetical protein
MKIFRADAPLAGADDESLGMTSSLVYRSNLVEGLKGYYLMANKLTKFTKVRHERSWIVVALLSRKERLVKYEYPII